MEFKFTIITRNGDHIVADPAPTGWETVSVDLNRDQIWHGVFFDYSLEPLSFVGSPGALIQQEYDNYGVSGIMQLRVDVRCSDGQYTEFYQGNIDFTTFEQDCGLECRVTVQIEDTQDIMRFRNNYNQKVNLNSNIAFDKETVLTDYAALNMDMTIPGRGLPLLSKGNSITGPHVIYPINVIWPTISNAMYIRPNYSENVNSEIDETFLSGGLGYSLNQNIPPHPTAFDPFIRPEVSEACVSGIYDYTFRFKGHIQETTNAPHTATIQLVILKGDSYPNTGSPALQKITLITGSFGSGGGPNLDFDETFTGTVALAEGESLRAFIFLASTPNAALRTQNVWVDWDQETMGRVTTISQCDPTTSKVSLINEALSRCVEAITNGDIRFYSTFYGRTNSQPYAIDVNTCAGMQAITNGLNIRRKLLTDGTQPGFFVTMQQLFEHQRRVFNIGLSIEKDSNRAGFKRLRFEDWRYFYQNTYGGLFFQPNQVNKKVDPSRCFNRVSLGFTKWEAERFSGLDEFMTTREYRTGIESLDSPLDIKTDLITSPYAIEVTRRLDETTQDWKYDNDVFSFALAKDDLNYTVEQFEGTTTGVENISNPGSNYNARFRPAVIAMRFFGYVMQGIKNITAASRLIFTEGAANYIAKLKTNTCNIEGVPISENEDIDLTDFNNISDALPITQPELDSFEAPMTYNTFLRLLSEPDLKFKSIKYQCGENIFNGWINKLQYRIGQDGGVAQLEVIPINNAQAPTPTPPCTATVGSVDVDVIDVVAGTISVDFVELTPGADNWTWVIVNESAAIVQQGNTNVHPFQVSGLSSGIYGILIIPRCGENVGGNYGQTDFSIETASQGIQLSIMERGGEEFKTYRLVALRTGGGAFTNDFSFKAGSCKTDTAGTVCNGFPSSPNPISSATISGFAGNTSAGATLFPGTDNTGVVDSVTLFDLSGITAAQITKAPGELWTLNFE